MNVSDMFKRLAVGELKNISMSDNVNGVIKEASQPTIIVHANDGLLKLYSRFILRESEIMLELQEAITIYNLVPRFARNYVPVGAEPSEPIRYLIDTPEDHFKDELLKIIAVFNVNRQKIPLNDEQHYNSVFTPTIKRLQVPNPVPGGILNITYQRKHPVLTGDLTQEIECPEVLENALLSYIAYKVFSNMNSAESNVKSQEFLSTYEAVCVDSVMHDLVNSSISQTNSRFSRNGFI